MHRKNRIQLAKFNLLLGSAFSATTAFAQSPMLEEVIVTAAKRAESIMDVAGSITALGSQAIDDRSITNVEDLQGMVPNLNFRDLGGYRLISIRGIGGNIETGNVEPGVASHLDGVYLARGDMLSVDFNDLERVEVLRGPQGTLYGKNATGGAINFISKSPTEEFEGKLTVGGGNYGTQRAFGMVSGPLTDGVRGRASAFYDESDGYYENAFNGDDIGGAERWGVRGALSVDMGDNWTADLAVFHQESELDGPVQPQFAIDTNFLPNTVAAVFGATYKNSDKWHEIYQTSNPESELETTGTTLRIVGDLSDSITLTSTTGYFDHTNGPQIFPFGGTISDGPFSGGGEFDSATIGYEAFPREQASESFSQEFIFSGTTDSLDWLVGFYYFEEEYSIDIPFEFVDPNTQVLTGVGLGGAFPPGSRLLGQDQGFDEDNESIAVFFDVTWAFADKWRLNVGGRYAEEEKVAEQNIFSHVLLPTGGQVTAPLCPPNNEVKLDDDSFDPKLRLERDIGEDGLIYAQYQDGRKSGQANFVCDDFAEPEEITSYEIGYKATFLDGAATVSAAAFFYEYDNYQSLEFTPDGLSSFLTNVPEAEVLGGEIEFRWYATQSMSVDLAIGLLDSEITQSSPEIGGELFTGTQIDVKGNPLPSSPEYTFNAGMDYRFDFESASLTTRIEYMYMDEHAFRLFDVMEVHPEDGQNSYDLLNLYATLDLADGRYQVRGFVRNALDEEYKYWTLYSQLTGFAGSAAAPMTWGIDLSMNF